MDHFRPELFEVLGGIDAVSIGGDRGVGEIAEDRDQSVAESQRGEVASKVVLLLRRLQREPGHVYEIQPRFGALFGFVEFDEKIQPRVGHVDGAEVIVHQLCRIYWMTGDGGEHRAFARLQRADQTDSHFGFCSR